MCPKLSPTHPGILASKALKPKMETVLSLDNLLLHPQQSYNEAVKTERVVSRSKLLEDILSKVHPRPFAVICIAGPPPRGKSLFLSLMTKYLQSLSIKNDNIDDTFNATKPFQKRTFPNHNWGNEDQYFFVFKANADYLKCHRVKKENYDGSAPKMDPEFAIKVTEYIKHIIYSRKFPSKIIFRSTLVPETDRLQHFDQYVKVFSSFKMSASQDMNQPTALICNRDVVNRSYGKDLQYIEQFTQKQTLKNRVFVLDHELKNSYKIAADWALLQYQQSKIWWDGIQKYQALLQENMHNYYEKLCAENSNNRNYHQHQNDFAVEDSFYTFKFLYNSKFKRFASLNSDSVFSPDNWRILDRENLYTKFKYFKKKVALQNKSFLLECAQHVTNFVELYWDIIEKQENQNENRPFQDETETSAKFIKRFKNFVGFARLPSSTGERFLADLEKTISRTFDLVIEKFCPIMRKVLVQSYKGIINTFYGSRKEIIKDSDLQQKHKIEKERLLTKLIAIFSESEKSTFLSIKETLQDFGEEIDRFFNAVHEKHKLKKEADDQADKEGYWYGIFWSGPKKITNEFSLAFEEDWEGKYWNPIQS